MTGLTEQLAGFVAGLDYDSIPPEVAQRAKLLILDTVGISVRARHDAESTEAMMQAIEEMELDGGSCGVLGDSATYTAAGAAFANGSLAHSLDFDDTHAPASLHASAPVLPAALAAAERVKASGRDIIAGTIAGYEVICRLSMALNPSDHYERGFHPTATCGAMGAAAAAARVMKLDAAATASAFGIALNSASGTMQYLENGGWTKRSQIGNSAMAGLMAASMASKGYVGAAKSIEGKRGFLHNFAPNPDPAKVVAGLGEKWETMAIALKPYPACRATHAGADAAIALRHKHNIDPERIKSVKVGLFQTGINLVGTPLEQKQNPKSVVDGQFSMPFVAAVVLREGAMGWDDYATHLTDEATLALTRKVEVFNDPKTEEFYPDCLPASVSIELEDGTVVEEFVQYPKGEPENFVTDAELRSKFASLVRPYLGSDGEEKLFAAVMALEDRSAAELFSAARPAAPN
jgi:2-methylcitrate dehydratase PrpD